MTVIKEGILFGRRRQELGTVAHTLHEKASLTEDKRQIIQHDAYDSTDSNRICQSGYSVTGGADGQRSQLGRLGPLRPDYPLCSQAQSRTPPLWDPIDLLPEANADSNGQVRLTGHFARRKSPAQECTLWDSILPGFGLRMYPSGRKRWVVRFIERKKARQETVGDAATLDIHKARRMARKRLEAAALHGLPQRPRSVQRKGRIPTFAEVFETFRQDRPYAWKPTTEKSNLGTIASVLVPYFGARPIDEITKADVVAWRDAMSARTGTCKRTIPNLSAALA